MDKIDQLIAQIKQADAIIVGGGSGMSNAAGMNFWYEASPLFMKYMKYYHEKYHFDGIFNGFYTHFDSQEERWAYVLYSLKLVFEEPAQKPTYDYLRTVIGNKPVHYITTNQDGLFTKYFGSAKVSEIQGSDYYFQSKDTSTDQQLYYAPDIVAELIPKIKDHRLATKYFPKSPINGAPLSIWARSPEFLEDKRYHDEYQKINRFLGRYRQQRLLFIEMGVGRMTPMFIQEPFWELTQYLPQAFYININPKDSQTNTAIAEKSLLISDDINEILKIASARIKKGVAHD